MTYTRAQLDLAKKRQELIGDDAAYWFLHSRSAKAEKLRKSIRLNRKYKALRRIDRDYALYCMENK